jgi:hypothetical protein
MIGFRATALSAVLLLSALGATPAASPAPAPASSTTPAASFDPSIVTRSKAIYHQLETGSVDRSLLTPDAASKLTADLMKAVAAKLGPLGDPVTFEPIMSAQKGTSMQYAFLLTFGNGAKLDFVVGIDPANKFSTLAISPAQ